MIYVTTSRMKTNRPIIKLDKTKLDSTLEWAYLLLCFTTILIISMYYSLLPERIPTHIGLGGMVNQYGSKVSIWMLPILQIIIGVAGYYLIKRPHTFNYLTNITPENAETEYRKGVMILRVVFVMSALILGIVSAIFIRLAIS